VSFKNLLKASKVDLFSTLISAPVSNRKSILSPSLRSDENAYNDRNWENVVTVEICRTSKNPSDPVSLKSYPCLESFDPSSWIVH